MHIAISINNTAVCKLFLLNRPLKHKTGMPCLEEIPKVMENITTEDIATQPPEPFDDDFEGLSGEIPESDVPIIREITQTDRLNNRLLKSLLNRMNTGEVPQVLPNDKLTEDQSIDFEK